MYKCRHFENTKKLNNSFSSIVSFLHDNLVQTQGQRYKQMSKRNKNVLFYVFKHRKKVFAKVIITKGERKEK